MFGHNVFSYDAIPNSYNAESVVFNATEFDLPKNPPNSVKGIIRVKWDETTQTYHYKAYPMTDYADTGKSSASQVKDSTVEVNMGNHANGDPIVHSVKSKIDAGQGLEFDSLSPADQPATDDSGDSNGTPIQGCMDDTATNYDETATVDDGSCEFEGCMDDTATNYDESATVDDGSCEFEEDEIDPKIITYGIIGIVGIIAISMLKSK